MAFALAALRLFTIVLWVGGLCFFAFVVAPVAFRDLGDRHAAGLVVGGSLRLLHQIGLVSGALFAAATSARFLGDRKDRKIAFAEIALVSLMLGLTAFSQFSIIPRMDRARQNGESSRVPTQTEPGALFTALHVQSERVEGAVLLLGLGACGLLSWQASKPVQSR